MPDIRLENASVSINNDFMALKSVNLEIKQGEFVFVVGKNGSGKTTLLRALSTEILPSYGRLLIDEKDVKKLGKRKRPFVRRIFGVTAQNPEFLEDKTIFENIAFTLFVTGNPPKNIEQSVMAALGFAGMRKKAYRYPRELSGGELFRTSLARAIANDPDILVADEPTSNLDSDLAWDIMNIFADVNRSGKTVIVSTHAKDLVNIMRKRVITLNNGLIVGDARNGKYGDVF